MLGTDGMDRGRAIGRAVFCHGDGEAQLTLDATRIGVGHAIDETPVGGHRDVACGIARVPRPLSCILFTVGQLRHERQLVACGNASIFVFIIGIDKSAQLIVQQGAATDQSALFLLGETGHEVLVLPFPPSSIPIAL